METTVYQIEFKDGSTFRIFCANKSQIDRVITIYNKQKDSVKEITEITNGIHTVKQFEKILKHII